MGFLLSLLFTDIFHGLSHTVILKYFIDFFKILNSTLQEYLWREKDPIFLKISCGPK